LHVLRCVIGRGPLLLRWSQGGTDFEIHAWAFSGVTYTYPFLHRQTAAEIALAIGGVLGNLAAVAVIIALGAFCRLPAGIGVVMIFVQLVLVLANLYPVRFRTRGMELDSDGLRLWKLLRRRNDEPNPYGAYYLASLRRYDPLIDDAAVNSPLAPALLYWQTNTNRTTDPVTRRRVEHTLDDLLKDPTASKAERLLALDMLVTDGLLAQPRSTAEDLLAWSGQALELDDTNETVLESRAGVLIEAGQYREGKIILDRLAPAQGDFADALRRIFLARAEYELGNSAAARELVAQVIAMANAGRLSSDIIIRLNSVIDEIGQAEPEPVSENEATPAPAA
jgi:hypothetical protein